MFLIPLSLATPIVEIMCPDFYLPVCAVTKDHKQQQFANQCYATRAGAIVFSTSKCLGSTNGTITCPAYQKPSPVCGEINKKPKQFDTLCLALLNNAANIQTGACKPIEICPTIYAPVCAVLGGKKQIFSNRCEATRQGATNIVDGACSVPIGDPCTLKNPVCALLNGKRQTFANSCAAQNAHATDIKMGACPNSCQYTVCAYVSGKYQTIKNACIRDGILATNMRFGECPQFL
eukprot:NODE_47_length_32105_cov_1.240892.p17 type:complete len:234 gc:universal NODE_47_length_32105_cov_1.240892:20556-19855(-)